MGNKQAKLTIHAKKSVGEISPYIYGTALYSSGEDVTGTDAIWVGKDSSIPNIEGFRKNTVEVLKRLSPFVTSYCPGIFGTWEEMVGLRNKRPTRFDPIGRAKFEETPMERNPDFGIDEFLRFCELTNSEAMLRVGDEDIEDARHLVEYCNYEGTSRYAKMRAANGHPEPYNVKFWQLYTLTCMDPAESARAFRKFSWVARCIDPKIRLLCGSTGDFAERFFQELQKALDQDMGGPSLVDYISSINYFGAFNDEMDFSEESFYRTMHNAGGLEKFFLDNDALIQKFAKGRRPFGHFSTIDWMGYSASNERMCIGVTEWGISHRFRKSTLRDAVVGACVLDTYNRLCTVVPVATNTWTANMGSALVLTHGDKMCVTPMYHLFDMYGAHKGNTCVKVSLECDEIRVRAKGSVEDFAGGIVISDLPPLPVLSASASVRNTKREIVISVTNRDLKDTVEIEIDIQGAGTTVSGALTVLNSDDISDSNVPGLSEQVTLKTVKLQKQTNCFTLTIDPHSVNTMELKCE